LIILRPVSDETRKRRYAQFNLGLMRDKGQGVSRDHVQALKWYPKAAVQGHAGAQNNVAASYHKGEGVPQSYTEAVKWYTKAAERGFAQAQNILGAMYHKGQGVPQNYVLAHKWFNLAAMQGNAEAYTNRDIVAKKMTAADVSKAQKLASEWSAKFKKPADEQLGKQLSEIHKVLGIFK
jgi:TPR repeat protein